MRTPASFKGQITFSKASPLHAEKKVLMSYYLEVNEGGLDQIIMSSFGELNFSEEEKKCLSSNLRKQLNNYRQINPFALNLEALELIKEINKCKEEKIIIEAQDYGVYICLTALYSGEFPRKKSVEFHFNGSPLALFPKTLLKSSPKNDRHKIVYKIEENSWLKPFSTLHSHELIKCSFLKAA